MQDMFRNGYDSDRSYLKHHGVELSGFRHLPIPIKDD
jgi:hypothetical protein